MTRQKGNHPHTAHILFINYLFIGMTTNNQTYTAPGQGLASHLLAIVNHLSSENRLASQAFSGHLTNAFAWRTAIGTLALIALISYGVHIPSPDGWALSLAILATLTLVPAIVEYTLNTEEE